MAAFSICIPNYNYGNYLSETLESVLNQEVRDIEILVSDNASTDESVRLLEKFHQQDRRIKFRVNNCNVGFSGNLIKSASMASGEWMTMLSSDDLMQNSCLKIYKGIIDFLGNEADDVILSSAQDVIDSNGKKFNYIGVDWKLWTGAVRNDQLSEIAEADVWLLDSGKLLRNSLSLLRTPFAFASTTYSRKLYESVEGYTQGGIINPDKKFAWAILGKAKQALIIDKPLVAYRVHQQNQNSQQAESGALKYYVDQYVSTFQIGNDLLLKANLERSAVEQAFIEHDIALRGLVVLSSGNIQLSKRILRFGRAAYPHFFLKNKKVWALRILTFLGPLGSFIARKVKRRYYRIWLTRVNRIPESN